MKISRFLLVFFFLPVLFSCQKREASLASIDSHLTQKQALIGGITANPNEFPFIVNIWFNSPEEAYVDHLCGASLIHPKWVLTAAHCLLDDDSEKTQRPVKPSKLILYIGSDDITGQGGRVLKAKSILIHPDFSWPHNDVGLIELSAPVHDIQPVLLNEQDPEAFSATSINATVIGWGLTDQEGQISGELLQKLTLPIISRNTCSNDSFVRKAGWDISSDMLCADTTQNQKASCPGDSGGPLVINLNGRYTQIGIVSWGSACSGNPPRLHSNVEGHANVSDAYPWIREVIDSK